jgi:hypothetical protein
MNFDAASFDRWLTTDPRVGRPFCCAGCDARVYPDETDGVCCGACEDRLTAAMATEHPDCDCAECTWLAATLRASL